MAKPAGKMPNPCVPSRFCVILLATLPGYGIAENYGVLFCLWLCKLWAACPCTCVCLVCLKGHLASLELPLLPSFSSILSVIVGSRLFHSRNMHRSAYVASTLNKSRKAVGSDCFYWAAGKMSISSSSKDLSPLSCD